MTTPALLVEGLTKHFRTRRTVGGVFQVPWGTTTITALDRLDCEVKEGEFFGLLGVNGAGKSTFFKILSTLIIPDQGRATMLGGAPPSAMLQDFTALAVLSLVLLLLGSGAFLHGLRHARREGTVGQY